MELILASTSSYRRALLERLGVPFRCVNPGVDEDAFKSLGLGPIALAEALARAKAEAVVRAHPDAAVIGSDQLASLDDEILGKPGNVDAAAAQLAAMNGRMHRLFTAIAVACAGRVRTHTDTTTLSMRRLSSEEIRRYVLAELPLDCAGSYKIESRGIALFERIDCQDFTAIVGLPLMALAVILRDLGFAIP
jgi:septum formation protein